MKYLPQLIAAGMILSTSTIAQAAASNTDTAASTTHADSNAALAQVQATFDKNYPALEAMYKDIHEHPELAFQEKRTAAILAKKMRALGFDVTENVGKTGVVALYRNGPGPVVLIRTDMDALPMEEKTGLPYASRVQQEVDGNTYFVDHSCGHDIHMAWWVGTAEALLAMKDRWHGTLMFVAQPAEEVISGAKAMLDDGLFTRFPKPDYGFGAHIGADTLGTISVKQGVISSASDRISVRFHGVGAHGSMPDKSIDPIMQAGHFITGVQSTISRQKDPKKFGVVSVGSIHAGSVANIIPDHADLQLTLRSFDPETRKIINDGVVRTAKAAADMERAPAPEVEHVYGTGSVVNDPDLAARAATVLKGALGDSRVAFIPASEPGGTASEDYSEFVTAGMPNSVYFWIGGTPPETIAKYKSEGKPVPVNHSPYFAPSPKGSIKAGIETLTLATLMVAGTDAQ